MKLTEDDFNLINCAFDALIRQTYGSMDVMKHAEALKGLPNQFSDTALKIVELRAKLIQLKHSQ